VISAGRRERGNDNGRGVGREFSIQVSIFQLAKTEFSLLLMLAFLELLHAHDPAV
jgi:hypothetical protein